MSQGGEVPCTNRLLCTDCKFDMWKMVWMRVKHWCFSHTAAGLMVLLIVKGPTNLETSFWYSIQKRKVWAQVHLHQAAGASRWRRTGNPFLQGWEKRHLIMWACPKGERPMAELVRVLWVHTTQIRGRIGCGRPCSGELFPSLGYCVVWPSNSE